jgi:hypothetical protein
MVIACYIPKSIHRATAGLVESDWVNSSDQNIVIEEGKLFNACKIKP